MSVPFKQQKAAWRIILGYCDIRTAVSIFQTCRENRELSTEKTFWNFVCLRDFECKGTRKEYICRYEFGFWIAFDVNSTFLFDEAVPCYLFRSQKNFSVTWRDNFKHYGSRKRIAYCTIAMDRGNHTIMPLEKKIHSLERKEKYVRIDLHPLNKWLNERFSKRTNQVARAYYFEFRGVLKPGYKIGSYEGTEAWKFDASRERNYRVYYDGRLTINEVCPVCLWLDNTIRESPPKLLIDEIN